MLHFRTRRVVAPSDPPTPVEPLTESGLLREMHELIDILPNDMLEKASVGILSVPDFPEDFDQKEISRLERAKTDFRSGKLGRLSAARTSNHSVREHPGEYIGSMDETRENLHLLAEFMRGEILYEAVDVLKSVELLDIPEELTPEEWANVLAGREEIERGETYSWEEVKAEMFKETDV